LIFTAAGTQDGREIVRRLCAAGYDVAASVVSSYGQQLLAEQRENGGGRLVINDAPLDEANVSRFGEFLQEFAKNTQFIVVTHRKGTMRAADTMYGVTVEDAGVSKVLSIRLKDYEAEQSA